MQALAIDSEEGLYYSHDKVDQQEDSLATCGEGESR